jgi:hypothetical protein
MGDLSSRRSPFNSRTPLASRASTTSLVFILPRASPGDDYYFVSTYIASSTHMSAMATCAMCVVKHPQRRWTRGRAHHAREERRNDHDHGGIVGL